MNVNGIPLQTIRLASDNPAEVEIIDQRYLPHKLIHRRLRTLEDAAQAIQEMWVRGAPLIGVTAAYGLYLATLNLPDNQHFDYEFIQAATKLKNTRPTAVNLAWAVDSALFKISNAESYSQKQVVALDFAHHLMTEDIDTCKRIGTYGLALIQEIAEKKDTVNILTHCNAGWLGCVDYGTATAPMYLAYEAGLNIHVWVDETRPRNQGASLTAWELGSHGIPHTVIVDNAGGHLMQHNKVDLVIVGTDRTTRTGDVANKIGTYLKALAAFDNNVPFYVAVPSSSIDWQMRDGVKEIPIEERNQNEVKYVQGVLSDGTITEVLITPTFSPASNYGFDVTPARLITGFITERGICKATEAGLTALFPEKK